MIRQILIVSLPQFVFLIICIFWTVKCIRLKLGKGYLLKRCILTGVVGFYVSYISLTKAAINTFYCVNVHDSTALDDVDDTNVYWALDTSVKCFEGPHKVLEIVLAFPLTIMAVVLPAIIAIGLIYARNHRKLDSAWTQETVGLFYRGFEEKYIFWDAVILVRKALLAAIVVFGYQLGGDLQGIVAGSVLVVSLFLQMSLTPFKKSFGHLNELEGVSLLVSSLTFLTGVLLNDPKMHSQFIEFALVGLILFANVALAVFLIFMIMKVKILHLKFSLLKAGVELESYSSFAVLRTLTISTAVTLLKMAKRIWTRKGYEAEEIEEYEKRDHEIEVNVELSTSEGNLQRVQ